MGNDITWRGWARQGAARLGVAGRGKAWRGWAWQGKARQGFFILKSQFARTKYKKTDY